MTDTEPVERPPERDAGRSDSDCDGDGDTPAAGFGPDVRRLADWDAGELLDLRARFGSPLYVLDLDRVRENYARLDRAFPEATIQYAAKANALGHVLETLADAGAGVECASAGEVVRALDAGVSLDRIHYTAVNPPGRDLDAVVDRWERATATDAPDADADGRGFTITAGAADTVDRLGARGYDGRLCVRVNPGVGAGHHEKVQTGADATFGVPPERVHDVAARAAAAGMDVVGVHAHAGSGIHDAADLEAHRAVVARVGELARELDDAFDLEFVDVGGGLGVPYRETEDPLDLEAVASATRDALASAGVGADADGGAGTEVGAGARARDGVDLDLVVEPGRYLIADAGVLLTDVNTVKPVESSTVVGVDAGMTTLARPALYDAYHAIRNLSAAADDSGADDALRPEEPVTVAGPVCESSDVFASDRALAVPERGDVLAIGTAGAYGYEMASTYTSRPRPATVVLADGDASVARRRESLDDLTRLER